MSPRFGGIDRFGREHDRAREYAAARLAEPLAPSEAQWLDAHLAWCAPCRAVAAEYETQRIAFRSLRLDAPSPPRDLWARTAAAIEADRDARPVRRDPHAGGRVRGRQPFPIAPLAGLLVVAVAVGASLLNGAPFLQPQATGSPAAGSPSAPGPTPIAVAAREVPLVRQTADGTLVIQVGRIREVCPLGVADCGGEASIERRELGRVTAGTVSDVLLSPTRSHLVVLDRSAGGGGVYVVPMADLPGPTLPPATPGPDPTSDPTSTPQPTPAGSPDPSDAPTPPPPSDAPTTPPSPSLEPGTSEPPASEAPTEPAPSPSVAVSPGPAGALQIAADVVLVGSIAGYAADGSVFAFTARPADGSAGPDVYVWRAGDAEAHPVTTEHDVVFADWLGSSLLVSRAVVEADGVTARPVTVLLDPETGAETPVAAPAMWRPTVDPLGRAGVWWDGTVRRDADGFSWIPGDGRLVMAPWPGVEEPADEAEPSTPASASPDGAPVATVPAAVSPAAASPAVLASGPLRDWLVRWDETGTRLAVWIADPEDPAVGRLSLYAIDPTTGVIATDQPLLRDEPALEGFAIGAGRLAWSAVTPDGATQVEVLAWGQGVVGQVRFGPSEETVVVR